MCEINLTDINEMYITIYIYIFFFIPEKSDDNWANEIHFFLCVKFAQKTVTYEETTEAEKSINHLRPSKD